MDELDWALHAGWVRVRERLFGDGDELRARLGRRRLKGVMAPPRGMCVALRASDRRIDQPAAMLSPPGAAGRGLEMRHRVRIDASLVGEVCRPLDLTEWHGQLARDYAGRVGRTLGGIYYLRKKGLVREEKVKGLRGQRGWPVPLVWSASTIDPQSANGFRPVHRAWGWAWQTLADEMPEAFEQEVEREPVLRRAGSGRRGAGRGEAAGSHGWPGEVRGGPSPGGTGVCGADTPPPPRLFRGWRWVCPGCGRRVRTIYYPVAKLTLSEYWGDEGPLLRSAGTNAELDGIVRPPGTFACARCHGVKFWTELSHNGWNQLVTYLSGGLMYGREVEKPEGLFTGERRHAKPAKKFVRPSPRRDEVEKLLREGKKRKEIAVELGLSKETVNVHVKAIFKRLGIHRHRELIEGEG